MPDDSKEQLHSPGPWRYEDEFVRDADNNVVVSFDYDYYETENDKANARLIAAAPELLGACFGIWHWIEGHRANPAIAQPLAMAIKNATGKEPPGPPPNSAP